MVDVFVYYFQRSRPLYRSPVKTPLSRTSTAFSQRRMEAASAQVDVASEGAAAASSSSYPAAAASSQELVVPDAAAPPVPSPPSLSSLAAFHDVFSGCVIYIHRASSTSAADERLLARFVTAYDGDVAREVTARVTHLVTAEPFLTPELLALRQQASPRVRVLQLSWVEKCVSAGQLDDSMKLEVSAPPTST